jgi:hypothetical protein
MMMADKHDREIDWQAFLYVSGEISPADAETFEDQLAHDQEAREAVAAAVKLLGKLAAARPATTPGLPAVSTKVAEYEPIENRTPSPLMGEGWDGGGNGDRRAPPTPTLSHEGGGRTMTYPHTRFVDTEVVSPTPDSRARRFAAAATVAASLLVCWSLARHSPGPPSPSGEDARQLISYWSEAWSPGENGSADSVADDDDSEMNVPSWMLAAVEPALPKASEEN